MLNYDLYVHAHIKFCFVYIFTLSTIAVALHHNVEKIESFNLDCVYDYMPCYALTHWLQT